MNPREYKYTQEHEWICPEPGGGQVKKNDIAQLRLSIMAVSYTHLTLPTN